MGGDVSDLAQYEAPGFVPAHIRDVLESRLKKIEYAKIPEQQEVEGETPTTTLKKKADPEFLVPLRERAKYLHKQEAAVHSEMRLSDNPKRRYACASEIMRDIRPELDRIYDQIRAFEATGDIPALPAVIADSDALRKLLTLRSRASRIKATLDKGGLTEQRRKKLEFELHEKRQIIEKLDE
jgi:hypothetical protein